MCETQREFRSLTPELSNFAGCSPRNQKRARIGPSFFTVSAGHSFRSVIRALLSAECSCQFASVGTRGMTFARMSFAASAFANK